MKNVECKAAYLSYWQHGVLRWRHSLSLSYSCSRSPGTTMSPHRCLCRYWIVTQYGGASPLRVACRTLAITMQAQLSPFDAMGVSCIGSLPHGALPLSAEACSRGRHTQYRVRYGPLDNGLQHRVVGLHVATHAQATTAPVNHHKSPPNQLICRHLMHLLSRRCLNA
jgi:hypothetical protein